jgi:hypothetical protein
MSRLIQKRRSGPVYTPSSAQTASPLTTVPLQLHAYAAFAISVTLAHQHDWHCHDNAPQNRPALPGDADAGNHATSTN